MVSFPPVSPPRPYTPPSPNPYALHAQPIPFFSILSPAQYWVSSTTHLAPRYAIPTIPSSVQIFSSTPCSQTPLASFPPAISAIKFHTHTKHFSKHYILKVLVVQCCAHFSKCHSHTQVLLISDLFYVPNLRIYLNGGITMCL